MNAIKFAVDQPSFAIVKQIQWNWPASHGENQLVIMLGGLHIEMAVGEGAFVVHKSPRTFSSIALEIHMTNALAKGGGAVGLTLSPGTLLQWMVAGPERARITQEFEESMLLSQRKIYASTSKYQEYRFCLRRTLHPWCLYLMMQL